MSHRTLPRLTSCALAVLAGLALAQDARVGPSPYSGGFLMARDVAAGRIVPGRVDQAPVNGRTATACSPRPCVLPNSQASAGPAPVNEDAMAVDPINHQYVTTTGNDYNCGSLQGIYSSMDNGRTWKRQCMTPMAGNGGLGDISPGYDTQGNDYVVGINSPNGGSTGTVVVQKSTDHGQTWGTAHVAVTNVLGGLPDKPWLEIDTNATSPRKDSLYVSDTQFDASSNSQISVSHSTNGGTTWTTVKASAFHTFPEVAQFSDLAVGTDGTVYLSYMICTANGPTGDCGGTVAKMMFQKSTDGGATWSSPVQMATVKMAADSCGAFYGCLPNTPERLSNIPTIAVDTSGGARNGQLYAVMYNAGSSGLKVEVVSSTDGGATWGAPVLVSPNTANDQFFPWLNVGPTGLVGVTWLDRRNDPANVNYDAYLTASSNGNASYPASLKVSTAISDPFNDGFGGGFMGDYTGNAWAGANVFYMSYMDMRTGISQDFLVGARR
jgi:hypothetical protein